MMKVRRQRAVIAIGLFSGLVIGYVGLTSIGPNNIAIVSESEEFRHVVVVGRTLKSGHVLESVDLELRGWPTNLLPGGYFSSPALVIGRVLKSDVMPGEILLRDKLAPQNQTNILPVSFR